MSVLPPFVFVGKRVGRRLQALTRESMTLKASMNTLITERFNVAGALLMKLFGSPETEASRFDDKAGKVADVTVRSATTGKLFFSILSTVGGVGTALVYLIGGHIALTSQSLTAGEVLSFALLLGRAYSPINGLTAAPVEILTALVSFDRVFEVLDLPHEIADKPGAVALAHPRGEVVFDHVWFAYPPAASLASLQEDLSPALASTPDPPVLCDLSFAALPGQTVAASSPPWRWEY